MLSREGVSELSPEPTTFAEDLQSPAVITALAKSLVERAATPQPLDGIGRAIANILEAHDRLVKDFTRHLGEAGTQLARAFASFDDGVRELEPAARELDERGWTIPVWQAVPLIGWVVKSVPSGDVDALSRRFTLSAGADAKRN